MNEHVLPKRREPTQAADGVPRWRWTLEEFDKLADLGVFGEGERVELIGGEIVPMSPKGNHHETMRARLAIWFRRNLPDDVEYLAEPGWRPERSAYLEPDFLLIPQDAPLHETPAPDVLLVVEVAVNSEVFDLTTKALTYAALGVSEYWVVNGKSGVTHVHREPTVEGYQSVAEVAPDAELRAQRIDGLSLRVADVRA